MRIVLIAPTALDTSGRPIKQQRIHLPGLTLPMLAAVTPPDVQLRLVNETVEKIPFHEPWDLVGLTGMGSGLVRAWQIADSFRKRGRKVVIGGIAASLVNPAWTLAHADCVVIGEAEELWPQVIRDAQAGRLQPIYRMQQPPDIKDLPLPRYDRMTSRTFGWWSPVQATRGCPFTCTFCSVTAFFHQGYRKRPVGQVLRDVREAKRMHGSRYVAFIDDNIGVDWDYCRELWQALIPEKIVWMSQCSLHVASRPDMLKLARQSGCCLLSFGIESTNPDSLETIDKAWNRPERYAEAVATIRAHGIDVSTEMIVGLDQDDRTVFQQTYDFLMENRISVPRNSHPDADPRERRCTTACWPTGGLSRRNWAATVAARSSSGRAGWSQPSCRPATGRCTNGCSPGAASGIGSAATGPGLGPGCGHSSWA